MNLVNFALAAEQFAASQPPITVEATRCLRARDKSADCDRCVRTCPSEAISFDSGVKLDADACIRCGLCLHSCPTGAFSGHDDQHRLTFCISQLVDHEAVEIACALHPDPGLGDAKVDAVITTTGCLAALGASAYLSLAAQGVEHIAARLDACAQCPLALLQPEIERLIHQAGDLLQIVGSPQTVGVAPVLSQTKRRPVYSIKNPPMSRRGLFQAFSQRGRDLLPSVEDVGERQRLIDALRRLKPTNLDQPLPGSAASLTCSDDCNACATCARICPTGALELAHSEDGFQLTFAAAKCIDCGLCLKFCQPRALQRQGAATIGEVIGDESLILQAGVLKRCRKCHALFAGEAVDGLCPICAFRRQQPFGGAPRDQVRNPVFDQKDEKRWFN